MNGSYNNTSDHSPLEPRVISFTLQKEFYERVKNTVDSTMFNGDWTAIWRTVVDAHANFEGDLTIDELTAYFEAKHPALPDSTRDRYMERIDQLNPHPGKNFDLQMEVVQDFWKRQRAREISELSVKIFLGKSEEFGELKKLIDSSAVESVGRKKSYTEVQGGPDELLEVLGHKPEFTFNFEPLTELVPGLDRGHFGIIFARPETGKTTFCAFLAQDYIKRKHKVVMWGNEEPAIRTKLRVIQSYYALTKEEMLADLPGLRARYKEEIEPYLTVLDCVGTSIEEIDDYCKINKPDIMFIDQMDKVVVPGKFNRGDERLKEIYLQGREVAKKNECLVWAVSQASAEADGISELEYRFLDNSRTGKAGEADLIIGIGRVNGAGNQHIRRLCVSKNKQNGVHGTSNCVIDVARGVYEL